MRLIFTSFFIFCVFCIQAQTWATDSFLRVTTYFEQDELEPDFQVTIFDESKQCHFILMNNTLNRFHKREKKRVLKSSISKIDKHGNISFIKYLSVYLDRSVVKIFNDKFHVFHRYRSYSKKEGFYYQYYVFDKNWELEKSLKIRTPDGFHYYYLETEYFNIDAGDNLYILCNASGKITAYQREEFVGAYVFKYDKNGNFIKKTRIEKSILNQLKLNNNQLTFTAQKTDNNNFKTVDSVFAVQLDLELENRQQVFYKIHGDYSKIRKTYHGLNDGSQVIFIDSSYYDYYDSSITHQKKYIAFENKNGQRKWTILEDDIQPRQGVYFITALENNSILVHFKHQLVVIDKNGNYHQLWKLPYRQNIDLHYRFLDFIKHEDEIWILYERRKGIAVTIHFEKIKYAKTN